MADQCFCCWPIIVATTGWKMEVGLEGNLKTVLYCEKGQLDETSKHLQHQVELTRMVIQWDHEATVFLTLTSKIARVQTLLLLRWLTAKTRDGAWNLSSIIWGVQMWLSSPVSSAIAMERLNFSAMWKVRCRDVLLWTECLDPDLRVVAAHHNRDLLRTLICGFESDPRT